MLGLNFITTKTQLSILIISIGHFPFNLQVIFIYFADKSYYLIPEDKKKPGAAQRSLYYLIHGNPNSKSNAGW